MVSLNLGQKSYISWLCYWGKGIQVGCPDPNSPKFVISRDITFDENYMLQPRKESVVDITGSREERKQLSTYSGNGVLHYIHSDVWGPSQVPSTGGASYLLTLIDDFPEKFGCILSSIRAMCFLPSNSGRL